MSWPDSSLAIFVVLLAVVPVLAQIGPGGGGSGGSCELLESVTEYFYDNDINRMSSSDINVEWQAQILSSNTEDHSPKDFFSWVNLQEFDSRNTFNSFINLLDNYNPVVGMRDHYTAEHEEEMEVFYSQIRSTDIFSKLYEFLLCKGHVSSNSDFKEKFYEMWFNLYPSSGSATNDSCGFEGVFPGQLDTSVSPHRVIGFHSWIAFFREERASRVNYYGYVERKLYEPLLGGLNFRWYPDHVAKHGLKRQASTYIGTSPEFELALYTACTFEYPTGNCYVKVNGNIYRIFIDELRSRPGLQIQRAYPESDFGREG